MIVIIIISSICLLFILFWLPKKLGYPLIGKILAFSTLAATAIFILYQIFINDIFEKSSIKANLKENEIILNDYFKILEDKKDSLEGYYFFVDMKISDNDKNRILSEISKAKGFKIITEKNQLIENPNDFEINEKVTLNYKEGQLFTRKSYINVINEALIFDVISINESNNILTFKRFTD